MGKMKCSVGFCDMQTMIHCSLFIFFVGGLATMVFYRNNKQIVASHDVISSSATLTNAITNKTQVFDHQLIGKLKSPPSATCDLFSGRWVYDNKSHYPLYKEDECPYLEDTFACQTYGRNDSSYLHWRWQPHGACDFPRFDGKAIVERLRGKRLLFVGDSLNRNQWNSMICMLYSSIPGVKRTGRDPSGHLRTFRAVDYNISVDFYWAPMLVESNGDSPTNHHSDYRIVRIKSIMKHAIHWVDSDVLIFNSYHWWRLIVLKLLKSDVSLLDEPNQEYEEVDRIHAYKMALETWSEWAQTHVDPSKTKLFFMGVTATHSRAVEWGGMSKMNCYGETGPVMDDIFWESQTDPEMMSVLETSLSKLKKTGVNVQIINITQLTQCRKDAHTTIYRKYWRPLTDEQKKNPRLASDCSHWCLPGVPDIWNELLLAYIFR